MVLRILLPMAAASGPCRMVLRILLPICH